MARSVWQVNKLPEPWHSVYDERQQAIRRRLQEFAEIPASQYFYELAFCILTPQSSAANAEATIAELIRDQFLEHGFDPTQALHSLPQREGTAVA
jgi:thermostable 8-oxoguanine DNA glycosylase